MLYTADNKNFKHQVHPLLKGRIKTFLILAAIMLALVVLNITHGTLSFGWAIISLAIGTLVGYASSRIFHLSWSENGNIVVGRVDRIGWFVLAAYIIFEIIRSMIFQAWMPTSAGAITLAFVSSALISRVVSLRGRIIRILREQNALQ